MFEAKGDTDCDHLWSFSYQTFSFKYEYCIKAFISLTPVRLICYTCVQSVCTSRSLRYILSLSQSLLIIRMAIILLLLFAAYSEQCLPALPAVTPTTPSAAPTRPSPSTLAPTQATSGGGKYGATQLFIKLIRWQNKKLSNWLGKIKFLCVSQFVQRKMLCPIPTVHLLYTFCTLSVHFLYTFWTPVSTNVFLFISGTPVKLRSNTAAFIAGSNKPVQKINWKGEGRRYKTHTL